MLFKSIFAILLRLAHYNSQGAYSETYWIAKNIGYKLIMALWIPFNIVDARMNDNQSEN